MHEHGQIGVVVIGRNEGERLVRCLASIQPDLPIVYVDSNSTDASVEAATRVGAEVVQLDITVPFTAARARNEGWRRLVASAPAVIYVQFVDGDCELESGWIETASKFLQANPRVAIVCGRRRERQPDASFFNRLCDEEWNTPIGDATDCGGDALVRLNALSASNGYDGMMMAGEEPELCWRLRAAGWDIHRLDAAMTIHDAAIFRMGQWWLRARRSGFGYAQVWDKTRHSDNALYGRELRSALIWAAAIPIAGVLLGLLFDPKLMLFAPLAWVLQIGRLVRRMGPRRGGLMMIVKFAELGGALRYGWRKLSRTGGMSITYK